MGWQKLNCIATRNHKLPASAKSLSYVDIYQATCCSDAINRRCRCSASLRQRLSRRSCKSLSICKLSQSSTHQPTRHSRLGTHSRWHGSTGIPEDGYIAYETGYMDDGPFHGELAPMQVPRRAAPGRGAATPWDRALDASATDSSTEPRAPGQDALPRSDAPCCVCTCGVVPGCAVLLGGEACVDYQECCGDL